MILHVLSTRIFKFCVQFNYNAIIVLMQEKEVELIQNVQDLHGVLTVGVCQDWLLMRAATHGHKTEHFQKVLYTPLTAFVRSHTHSHLRRPASSSALPEPARAPLFRHRDKKDSTGIDPMLLLSSEYCFNLIINDIA